MSKKSTNSLQSNISRRTIKIVISFISIILVIGFMMVSYFQYKSISQEAENALTNVCNLINRDLDIYVTNSINISNNLEILKILRNPSDESIQKKIDDSLAISTYLSMFDNNSANKVEYLIYTDNDTLYNTKYLNHLSGCPDKDILESMDKNAYDIFWTSNNSESYIFYQLIDTNPKYQSFLKVTIPKSMFNTYLENANNSDYTITLDNVQNSALLKKITISNGSNVFCNINRGILPKIYLLNLFYIVLIFVCCYMIIVFVVHISTNKLTRSIYDFLDRLKLNYLTNESDTASDLYEEFTVIEQKFSELAQVLKKQNQQIMDIDDERKTLELELWQAKFNPHLLYNSLSVIKWNIIKNESIENTTKLIDILTAYYRKILNKSNLFISLSEEIQLLKNYVEIMEYAHSQHYSFEYNVCKELEDYPIIKHSLQPLIENAVLHGLNQVPNAKIRLNAYCKDSRNYIEIKDNGRGMSKEKIDEILSDSYESVYKSYGIRNTRQRLLIFFGKENFDFKITSVPNEGTTITISW